MNLDNCRQNFQEFLLFDSSDFDRYCSTNITEREPLNVAEPRVQIEYAGYVSERVYII